MADYTRHLSLYPLDLIEGAYNEIIKAHKGVFWPQLSEFMDYIRPRFQERCREREDLRRQLEPEELAERVPQAEAAEWFRKCREAMETVPATGGRN